MAGRRLRIVHSTGYRYRAPVVASFNEVRMTPRDAEGQVLLSHQLHVSPRASVQAYVDYWGAHVQAFDVHGDHDSLEIVATSLVDAPDSVRRDQSGDWALMGSESTIDRWAEFLTPTPLADDALADPDRSGLVESLRRLPHPRTAVHAAIASVRDRIRYNDALTSVATTAGQAWALGGGVCQDYAHTSLSIIRALGIPARYVSGYLHTEDEAPGQTVIGESHAWIEVWLGDWNAFDPTNDRTVGAAHVVVARGRDYNDVPPLKGIYAGGASEALGVTVEITQLST